MLNLFIFLVINLAFSLAASSVWIVNLLFWCFFRSSYIADIKISVTVLFVAIVVTEASQLSPSINATI